MFGDKDPVTVLRFLAQFLQVLHWCRACDTNGLSEEKERRIMPTFMKDGHAPSLTVRMTSPGDGVSALDLPKVGRE